MPPDTMICLRARKVRDCCCLEELVSIQLVRGTLRTYGWVKGLCGDGPNSDCHTILHDDLVDLGVALEVEVLVNRSSAVDVCVSRVTSTTGLPNMLASK